VIAYYLRHREGVEQYLAEQQQEAAEVRKRIESIVANGTSASGSSPVVQSGKEKMLRVMTDEDFNGHIVRGVLLPAVRISTL